MRVNANLADQLAAQALRGSWDDDQDRLRDWLDGKTDGELDYHQLNILTDMVWKRITEEEVRQDEEMSKYNRSRR